MTENEERLTHKFLHKNLNEEEWETLLQWLEDPANKKVFNTYVKMDFRLNMSYRKVDWEASYEAVLQSLDQDHTTRKLWPHRRWWAMAASITLLIGLALGWYFLSDPMDVVSPEVVRTTIEQGTDGATLTLEDGSDILLQKGSSYETPYAKSNGAEVVYSAANRTSGTIYNTITVARGKQFGLTLSDGTQVWLNSDSKLKYPVSFGPDGNRLVELLYGEAYFDVTPAQESNGNAFIVQQEQQEIAVLGTEFNIKAYPGEARIYTTLVEGKVQVTHGGERAVLAPNDQSVLELGTGVLETVTVDAQAETAWRRGLFLFRSKTLGEIAVTLSRWYAIDIEIAEPSIRDVEFKGTLSKDQPLEEILELIKNTKFINAYDIEEHRVVIR